MDPISFPFSLQRLVWTGLQGRLSLSIYPYIFHPGLLVYPEDGGSISVNFYWTTPSNIAEVNSIVTAVTISDLDFKTIDSSLLIFHRTNIVAWLASKRASFRIQNMRAFS
jgi:hypothetical protein